MIVKKAKAVFKQYQNEIDKISTDLKESIQKDQKRQIKKKYEQPIADARMALESEAARLNQESAKALDPELQMVLMTQEYDTIPKGTENLIRSLSGLSDSMLDKIADTAKQPALLLSLYAQAGGIDEEKCKLRDKILSKVPIRKEPAINLLRQEASCRMALFDFYHIPGGNTDHRGTIAHAVNDIQRKIDSLTAGA